MQLKLLDFVLQDDFVFALDINLLVVLQETRIIFSFKLSQFGVLLIDLLLIMWYSCLRVVDAIESALENVDSVADDACKGEHSALTPTVSLCLSPDLLNDLIAERSSEFVLGLRVKYS